MRSKRKPTKTEVSNSKLDIKQEDVNKLVQTIRDYDKYFSKLIDLIPPKIYFQGNEEILEAIETEKKTKFSENSELSNKAKHKKLRLDPNMNKSVSEIANKFYANDSNGKKQSAKKSKLNGETKIELLQKKLKHRIEELQSSRGGVDGQKKRETKKERRRNNRNLKQKRDKSVHNQSLTENDGTNGSATDQKLPKIYNKEGNLVFSKFDFASNHVSYDEDNNTNNSKTKSLKKALFKVRKDEEKLSNLEELDADSAKRFKQKKMWRNALNRSEGIKVRDNSKMIEKSLNKRKKRKTKSFQQWKERTDNVSAKMEAKQEKRAKHIKAKREENLERKMKRMKKKGRVMNTKLKEICKQINNKNKI